MQTDAIYSDYRNLLGNLDTDESIFSNFKSDSRFTDILEHVDKAFGDRYKECIASEFNEKPSSFSDIITLNDSIGNPTKYDFDGISMSPTNLRYIYHSLLIKSKIERWFPGKKKIKILEIGGGYGGLCLYMNRICKDMEIEYTIIDLPEPSMLQRKFLNAVGVLRARTVSMKDIDTIAAEKFDLVISNYCISEIGRKNQEEYFNKLIVNCDKKFFIWNYLTKSKKFFFFDSMDIDFINKDDYLFEEERPKTGKNKFIYSK